MQQLFDFKQFCAMYCAGAGEFHFLNTETKVMFNLKFRPITNQPGWSHVLVCFANRQKSFFYFYSNIGKCDLSNHLFAIKTDQSATDIKAQRLLTAFNWIENSVLKNKPFPRNVLFYYAGNCCRCGKKLVTEQSLLQGFGEVCCYFNENDRFRLHKPN